MNNKYGLLKTASKGRELFAEYKGVKYQRLPIVTPRVLIGDDLNKFIEEYGKPYFEKDDIFCISAKVVSLSKAFVVHESEVKVSLLAKFIVKFVTKWPEDIGYSHPRKMQVAINQAGYLRILVALFFGTILKFLGKPGYFYKIAGHNINAIDGFNPVSEPPMNEYAVLPPGNGDQICTEIEKKFDIKTAILDGNNIDNNVLGMSDGLKQKFTKEELMIILAGNPQGQEDDGVRTPLLLVRKL